MNKDKEWLLREFKKIPHEFQDGYLKVNAINILPLIDQLDEPEKVVIPQFVADWWERDDDSVTLYGGARVEKEYKFHLISKFYDKGLGDYLSKVEDWIDENRSIFLELVNGKPYEVEKEPLYVVEDNRYCLLCKLDGMVISTHLSESDEISLGHLDFELTEKEIKDYDERYWAFAVEVTE